MAELENIKIVLEADIAPLVAGLTAAQAAVTTFGRAAVASGGSTKAVTAGIQSVGAAAGVTSRQVAAINTSLATFGKTSSVAGQTTKAAASGIAGIGTSAGLTAKQLAAVNTNLANFGRISAISSRSSAANAAGIQSIGAASGLSATQLGRINTNLANYGRVSSLAGRGAGEVAAATSRLTAATTAGNAALVAQAGRMGAATGAITRFGTSLAAVRGPATAAAVAVIAFGLAAKSSVSAAIEFESAMAGVAKTVDASPAQLEAVADAIRQMSTEIPAATTEIARVAEVAGQLGVEVENIAAFTRVMIDLGNTTDLSAEKAAFALARFGAVMGSVTEQNDPEYFERVGSTLVDLGNNFAATESEIATFAVRIAGAGQAVGLSEAEVLAFSTALASVGVFAEAGGTAVSRVLLDMASAADEGGAKLQAFADIAGVSADEFVAFFDKAEDGSSRAAEAFELVVNGLGRISAQTGETTQAFASVTEALQAVGLNNIRVRDSLLRLAGAGERVSDTLRLANAAFSTNSALAEEASKRYETVASRLEVFVNRLKDLQLAASPAILGGLNAALDGIEAVAGILGPSLGNLAGAVGDLFEAFLPLFELLGSAAIAGAVVYYEALAVAIGAIATAIRLVAGTVEVFGSLLDAAGPLGVAFGAASIAATVFGSSMVTMAGRVGTAVAGINPAFALIAAVGVALGLAGRQFQDSAKRAQEAADDWKDAIDTAFQEGDLEGVTRMVDQLETEIARLEGVVEEASFGSGGFLDGVGDFLDVYNPFVGNDELKSPLVDSKELSDAKAQLEALQGLYDDTAQEQARFAARVLEGSAALGVGQERYIQVAENMGLLNAVTEGSILVRTFSNSLLGREIERRGEIVEALGGNATAYERLTDEQARASAAGEDMINGFGLLAETINQSESALASLADAVGFDAADILDPDKVIEVGNAILEQVDAWRILGEEVGISSASFVANNQAQFEMEASIGALSAQLENATAAQTAYNFQTQLSADAQAQYNSLFEENSQGILVQTGSMEELAQALGALNLAYAASGVSAGDALANQEQLFAQFQEAGRAANLSEVEITELAKAFLLIPETTIARIAVEGLEARQEVEAFERILNNFITKQYLAELRLGFSAGGGSGGDNIVAVTREVYALVDAGLALDGNTYTAQIDIDAAKALSELLVMEAILGAFASGNYEALLGINDVQFQAGIAGALVQLGFLTDEEYTAIINGSGDWETVLNAAIARAELWDGASYTSQVIAEALGFDDVDALDDIIDQIDPEKIIEILAKTEGEEQLIELAKLINSITGKQIVIGATLVTGGGRAINTTIVENEVPIARGGIFKAYAKGGYDNSGDVANAHQPHIAPAGSWRVFGEPETRGESYVPHANDSRRGRAHQIMARTAQILGGQYRYAEGGVLESLGGRVRHNASGDFTSGGVPQLNLQLNVVVDGQLLGNVSEGLGGLTNVLTTISDAAKESSLNVASVGEAAKESTVNTASFGEAAKESTISVASVGEAAKESSLNVASVGESFKNTATNGQELKTALGETTDAVRGSGEVVGEWGDQLAEVTGLAGEGFEEVGASSGNMAELFIGATDTMIAAAAEAGRGIVEEFTFIEWVDVFSTMGDGFDEAITAIVEATDGNVEQLIAVFAEAGVDVSDAFIEGMKPEELAQALTDLGLSAEEVFQALLIAFEGDIPAAMDALIDLGVELEDTFVDAFLEGGSASEVLIAALTDVSAAADDVDDAFSRASEAAELLFGGVVSLLEAELDYIDAQEEVNELLNDGSTSFDKNTEAGRKNLATLLDAAQATQDYAEELIQSGISAEEAVAAYNEMNAALVEMFVQAGLTRGEAEALADEFLGFPDEVVTEIAVEAQEADAAVEDFKTKAEEPVVVPVTVELQGSSGEALRGTSEFDGVFDGRSLIGGGGGGGGGSDAVIVIDVEADTTPAETTFVSFTDQVTDQPMTAFVEADTTAAETSFIELAEAPVFAEPQIVPVEADTEEAVATIEELVASPTFTEPNLILIGADPEEFATEMEEIDAVLTLLGETPTAAPIEAETTLFDEAIIAITEALLLLSEEPTLIPIEILDLELLLENLALILEALGEIAPDEPWLVDFEFDPLLETLIGELLPAVLEALEEIAPDDPWLIALEFVPTLLEIADELGTLADAILEVAREEPWEILMELDPDLTIIEAIGDIADALTELLDGNPYEIEMDLDNLAVLTAIGEVDTALAALLDGNPYTVVLDATDNASATIGAAHGAAIAFEGTYTATLVTNDITNVIVNTTTTSSGPVVTGTSSDAPRAAFADGGVVGFADGTENHIAQIARAGAWRVWAEPETGGEAYIPLAPAKRDRSLQILEQVANMFGRQVVPMANGGIVGPGSGGMNSRVLVINEGAVQIAIDGAKSPYETQRQVEQTVTRALEKFTDSLDGELARR